VAEIFNRGDVWDFFCGCFLYSLYYDFLYYCFVVAMLGELSGFHYYSQVLNSDISETEKCLVESSIHREL
jgi:hypothetical protein